MSDLLTRLWAFAVKREFIKFLLVGLTNTALSYGVYIVLNRYLSYTLAYSIAYVAGFFCSYYLNSRWVFKMELSWKTFLSYPLVYLAQFLINLVCLRVLVEEFLMSETLAPLIVIVISIPITFLLSRLIIKPRS